MVVDRRCKVKGKLRNAFCLCLLRNGDRSEFCYTLPVDPISYVLFSLQIIVVGSSACSDGPKSYFKIVSSLRSVYIE